ncbi:BTAD domain-containing putative transcriptional regulator [Streptomyces sp. NPDC002992]|uniref:BTAD domain-containing putative transcriptional regulator n=1 Tax=Streptomyces sp. NPDC002992 TaxID=3154273 RepID=UPI0033B5F450
MEIEAGELDAEVFGTRLRRAQDAHRSEDWETVDEESTSALALWRGRPLPEFPLLHGTPEIDHLVELQLQAVELRFESHLHTSRHHAITAEVARYAAEHPLREPFHRQLMAALRGAERTGEAISAYHSLRRSLADELGIDPAPATQQLFRELLAPDTSAAGPARMALPATDPPRSATEVDGTTPRSAHASHGPFQIPRDIADFTGRTAELTALRERLLTASADGLPAVVVISGMGGVGKTSLAIRAAHSTRAVFPDGQLHADLRGFGSGAPRTAHDLLARFLADLGTPAASLPDDIDDRAALYRATLAARRVLILLDNARDSQQVAPLLIGSGASAVVVTSRHALAGLTPANHITLQPLDATEQEQLLASICGPGRLFAEQSATERILSACAGLPLALRIVGARLARHSGRSLGTMADRLDQDGRRLSALTLDHLDVSNVFQMSYQALGNSPRETERDAATAFRQLGLWTGHPFSAEAAAALLDHPVERTLELLDILVDAHLLQSPTPGSYRFHDLLGEFAGRIVATEESAEDRQAGLVRLLTWYCAALHHADEATETRTAFVPAPPVTGAPLPEFEDGATALAWISRELPAITTAISTAADSTRPELAWRTAGYLFGWIIANWWTRQWEQPLAAALATARREHDLAGQAQMHNLLGVAHGVSYRSEASLIHLGEAAALYGKLGNIEQQAVTLSNYANACGQIGRFDDGLTAIRQAVHLHTASGALPLSILHTQGSLLLDTGATADAEKVFRRCLTICHTENRSRHLPTVLVNLGDTLRAQDRRDEAFTHLEEALQLAQDLDNPFSVADALEALARAHAHFGDPEQARSCWQTALEIAEQHQLDRVIRDCLTGLSALEEDG